MGNEEVLKAALPGTAIIPATLTTAVHLSAPGTVTAWHKGGIGLAPSSEGAPVTDLAAAFRTAGLATRCYDDGPSLKWSKLLLNLLGTACSAVLEWPPSRVLRDRRLFEVERAAWLEALAVMRAMGLQVVPLPGYRVDWMAHLARLPPFLLQPFVHRGVARERGQRLPSVALDLARGRRTEVEVLNGAVARHASLVGVAAPVNRALNNLIGDLSAGHLDRRRYLGRPDRLLASLEQEVRAATIARKGGAGQATSDGHGGAQADGRQAKSRTPTPRAGRRPRPNKRG